VPRAKASKAKATTQKRPVGPTEQLAPEVPDSSTAGGEQALVDRYHAMAEELNGRGAMELAVPFYRQTIALLLAEREQLRSLAGAEATGALPASADVDGVLAAAAVVDSALPEPELLRQLTALEEELSEHNHQEVAVALQVLQEQWGQPHPQLLALEAKLHLLEGALGKARDCFEQALALGGQCVRLRLNTGAARLADGDVPAALELLRPLTNELPALEVRGALGSFWNNLTRAELAAEQSERAAAAVQQWLHHAPHTLELEAWLEQAQALHQAGRGDAALVLLQALADGGTPEQRRQVLPELATLLEAAGSFREAAMVYRELLRPGLAA
jgi:tetratricopeptide (TPR) repeat protein